MASSERRIRNQIRLAAQYVGYLLPVIQLTSIRYMNISYKALSILWLRSASLSAFGIQALHLVWHIHYSRTVCFHRRLALTNFELSITIARHLAQAIIRRRGCFVAMLTMGRVEGGEDSCGGGFVLVLG